MSTDDSTTLNKKTPNIVGQTFGRLTVVSFAGYHTNGGSCTYAFWMCRCICNPEQIKPYRADILRSGRVQSCGCYQRDMRRQRSLRHGQAQDGKKTPEYHCWGSMLHRCRNPHNKNFHHYGGRGITVCQEWVDSFETFFADMGPRPSPTHSLERKDNALGYTPDNCLWATRAEQQLNRRTTRLLTYKGRTMCLKEWGKELETSPQVLAGRLQRGYSVERALGTPIARKKKAPTRA